jgi:hypothetical protein
MKTFDFTPRAGLGFPFDQDTMRVVQDEIFAVANLALLGGNQYILSGCAVIGANVSDGIVVINGEILAFIGGNVSDKVVIIEMDSPLNFLDTASLAITPINVVKDRVARFGDDGSLNPYLWVDFKRNNPNNGLLGRVDKIEKMLKPLMGYDDPDNPGTTVYGSWLFWGRIAAQIPSGWEPVPDAEWKGRVPVVLDVDQVEFNTIGKIGGENTHLLNVEEMPAHKHTFDGSGDNATDDTSDRGQFRNNNDRPGNYGAHMNNTGGDQPHNNLQPYKVVMFIRFIG